MLTEIREFAPEDRDAYIRLSREFYQSKAVDHNVPEDFFHATFDACLEKSPYCKGFLVLWEGEVAGYALISFTWSNEVGGLVVLLEEGYLSPAYRSKGLGSAFLTFMEKEYADKAKRFRLEVTPVNQRAISLYERLGYQKMTYIQMAKDTP